MWRRSRVVVGAAVLGALLVLTIPDALLSIAVTVGEFVRAQIRAVGQPVPRPVLIGLGIAVLFVASFLIIFAVVRWFSTVGLPGGARVSRWYDRLRPDSPVTTALVVMIALAVVFFAGFAVFIPWLGTTLTSGAGLDDVVGDVTQGDDANVSSQFEEDAIRPGDGTEISRKESGVDTDGDGLADSWERAGETPWGAAIADADPNRLDLFVRISYGDGVSPLTESERRQLRSVWDDMPVENPDGSTGITLHLSDTRSGQDVRVTDSSDVDRFYTEDRLGSRYCVDYQVTLGQGEGGVPIGYAETPGYASVYNGSEFEEYDGDVSFRVATITHALLHNVVGGVDGGVHSDGGWLEYPDPENEHLTDGVARQIETEGFVTTQSWHERCPSRTNATGSSSLSG